MLPFLDWKNGRGFADVLEIFLIATRIQEGEKYLTLSSVIPVLSILHQKTHQYIKNKDKNGFGITFARNILSSLEDRFGRYPTFLTLKPHCFSTISDPRFKHIYFSRKPEMEEVRSTVCEWVKEEMEKMESSAQNVSSDSNESNGDEFWGAFDKAAKKSSNPEYNSIDSELHRWSQVAPLSRETNPLHAMDALKTDYPHIFEIFRKYCVFPSTQNRDERIFSMMARCTGPQCRSITVETLEKKILIGCAIRSNGFIFSYLNGADSSEGE